MVLSVRSISKHFGARKVLNDVSFNIEGGEILGFVGPNGAGKTTAIKVILGLLHADAGEVFIDGMNTVTQHDEALREVGAIIESPDLYDYLTGRENLMQFARIHGVPEERVDVTAATVGLSNRINDKVKTYSLGMRQRLGVAQAMLHDPKLLLLDEPTNGLDPAGIKDLRETLCALAAEGKAILVSSHLLSELELMCNSLCIIENGVVIARRSFGEGNEQKVEREVYIFEVDDAGRASGLLSDKGFPVGDEDGRIVMSLTSDEAASAAEALVTSGIKLYLMAKKHKSLEDTYLEYTADPAKGGGVR